ncbi:QWRF motif-containing protein 7-like isoform X2 [Phragmites australis]|uniref:QWRF motif-containing protein 7-like isoform X2 n=1 Tax=Phragmites australis TaxID=29695 RepID=UPI002D784BF2|nr:QWRF motif-containing protein 7-like isoform X2 [Phragmites australis]
MESGGAPRPRTSASSRRPCAAEASRAGSGAFVYDGMRATPLSTSTANFTRSLRKGASFAQKKPLPSADVPPLRSSKENNSAGEDALLAPPRRSMPEPGVDARGLWEPSPRRRRSTGSEDAAGRGSSGALREMMARRKEEPEKEEAAHRARVLTARLLQWRFANARMEKAMARATSAAENRLFYTWLRVAELRNIQAAKRIVAQRRRQKLKLARLLRPQLPLLASWEPLAKPHTDATADLGRVLSAACTNLPLAAGAQADLQSLHDTMFSCLGTVNEIEAITDMFHAPAGATSSALGELVRTIQQELECLEEATRLSSIVTGLQMQEVSLRANLIQAKQRLDLGLGVVVVVVPTLATSGWCF